MSLVLTVYFQSDGYSAPVVGTRLRLAVSLEIRRSDVYIVIWDSIFILGRSQPIEHLILNSFNTDFILF